MLDQLIYTRCKPHRELKKRGQVVRSEGFGVFSMSQGMVTNPPIPSYDYLQARLAVPNGAKENSSIGLFNSYEYSALTSDIFAMSFEVARPLCTKPRKNGQGHRSGNYIKQCLVGRLDDYPFKWFGASAWDAHLKSENDYYLDENPNAEPEWLNTVQETPYGSYITIEKVKEFVDEGRADAVKAGVWFLIHEYAKPESDRKVLLIKDTPENVEHWIAAIEYAFSIELAKGITFSTNKSRLGTQTDNILFYYTDEAGKFFPMRNNSVKQRRHPYCMIVGYHPKDTFCSSVKQMPTSNFVLIDGITKKAEFSTDDSICSAYYSALVQYNEDILDFTSVVLPSLPMTIITDKIPELYDAYKYLLDSDHRVEKWSYGEAVAKLQALTQYGISKNDALNKYILDECLRGYQRFASEDERNCYSLLQIVWDIGLSTKRTREVTGCLADQLSPGLMNLKSSGNALVVTWNAIKAGGVKGIIQPAFLELFNDSELASYSSQFTGASATVIGTILDMYYDTLSLERNGINALLESNVKYQFVCRGIIALIDDRNALRAALNGIRKSDDVVNAIALTVSRYLEQNMPDKTEIWWDSIIELSGGNVMDLCSALCKSNKTNIDIIEHLIANAIMKAGKCEQEQYRAFEKSIKLLGKSQDTGVLFFSACIKVEDASRLDGLIRGIRGSRLSPFAEKKLFKLVDEYIPYESTLGMISNTIREMREWGSAIGEISSSVSLYDLRKNMERERKAERVLPIMYEFVNLKMELPNAFINSQLFAGLAQIAAEFCNSEVHMAFLHLFDFSDIRKKQEYISAYINMALSCLKGKQLINLMISLCEAIIYEYQIPRRKTAQVKETADILKSCFSKVLPTYYKPNLADQVFRVNYGDPQAKKLLLSMLQDAAQKAPKSGLGGFLGGIFGR